MLNIKFKCNIINIMDPYSAANTRKNPYDNQYSDYFNNIYDYLSLQSETSNRFPKHREIKIVPTNVDKQKVQKMDDKVPSLLDFGNTKGLDFGNTKGLDFGNTKGLDFGNTKGLDFGNTKGLDFGNTKGLDFGNTKGLDFGNTKGLDFGNTKGLDFGNQKILPKRSQLYDNFTDKKMNIKNIINNSKTEYPFCKSLNRTTIDILPTELKKTNTRIVQHIYTSPINNAKSFNSSVHNETQITEQSKQPKQSISTYMIKPIERSKSSLEINSNESTNQNISTEQIISSIIVPSKIDMCNINLDNIVTSSEINTHDINLDIQMINSRDLKDENNHIESNDNHLIDAQIIQSFEPIHCESQMNCSTNFITIISNTESDKINMKEKFLNVQKIDNKNSNNIRKMNDQVDIKMNSIMYDSSSNLISTIKNGIKEKWPSLSLDNLNTSFKVIGELRSGSKLKVSKKSFFIVDDSYSRIFASANPDANREIIINFLEHMLEETRRNVDDLLKKISDKISVNDNLMNLYNFIYNMIIFIHNFDTMKDVYITDSGVYARLEIIRNNYRTFLENFYKRIIVDKMS